METRVVETRTYERDCVVVYAAQEAEIGEESRASLEFDLEVVPEEPVALRLVGLDDDQDVRAQIAIELNDQRIYEGESLFENASPGGDDGDGWTRVVFVIPPDLLQEGGNTVTVINLGVTTEVEVNVEVQQQFVLLAKASIRSADDELLASVEATATAGGDDDGSDDDGDDNGGDDTGGAVVAFLIEDRNDDNGDGNRGHGNDADGNDEDNPGNSGGKNGNNAKKDNKGNGKNDDD